MGGARCGGTRWPCGERGFSARPSDRARIPVLRVKRPGLAILNYYKANYPREPYTLDTSPLVKVKAPVLMIHGLNDQFLLAGALNSTWELVESDLTIATIPNAGHFIQHEAAEMVTRTMLMWLGR